MRIAVAGGTGTVGRHVVEVLTATGHQPVVLTRSRGVDVTTGEGVDEALAGTQAVIDVSNLTTFRARTSRGFFTAATTQLLEAGRRAGVDHHVALSIVGADRVDFGYYQGKRVQEQLVLAADGVGSVLRATQFYEFAGQLLASAPGPLAVVPRMRTQPIAAREVAAALADLATGAPVGLAPELAGPQEQDMVDMARRVVHARGQRRRVVGLRLPGAVGRQFATGGLLPTGAGPRGTQTFEQWLTSSDGPGSGLPGTPADGEPHR